MRKLGLCFFDRERDSAVSVRVFVDIVQLTQRSAQSVEFAVSDVCIFVDAFAELQWIFISVQPVASVHYLMCLICCEAFQKSPQSLNYSNLMNFCSVSYMYFG